MLWSWLEEHRSATCLAVFEVSHGAVRERALAETYRHRGTRMKVQRALGRHRSGMPVLQARERQLPMLSEGGRPQCRGLQ